MVGNSAVAGVESDYREKSELKPTLVTIMLGNNDVIHQDWTFNPPLAWGQEGALDATPFIDRTRADCGIQAAIDSLKDNGAHP